MTCFSYILPSKSLIFFLSFMNIFSKPYALEAEANCDHYILLHSNMTYKGISKGMEEKRTATILAHTFQAKVLVNSPCSFITSCAPQQSIPHMSLMTAIKTQKSLSWKLLPCFDQQVFTSHNKEKETGYFFQNYSFIIFFKKKL